MSITNLWEGRLVGLRSGISCRAPSRGGCLTFTFLPPTAAVFRRLAGLMASLIVAWAALAQMEFLPAAAPQAVFAGQPSAIQVTLRNLGPDEVHTEFSTRLFQVSSTTTMPVGGPQPWKRIQALAGQTIVESVPVSLPEVRVITPFRLQILAGEKSVAQYTIVACPPDLLKQLPAITGGKPVGIFDPEGRLSPVFNKTGAASVVIDIGDNDPSDDYALAILGPFSSPDKVPADLAARAHELAKRNVTVIALLPPGALGGLTQAGLLQLPMASSGNTRSSVLFSEAGANEFAGSASSQLALYRMAELALGLYSPLGKMPAVKASAQRTFRHE